jgi:hypothetical protein
MLLDRNFHFGLQSPIQYKPNPHPGSCERVIYFLGQPSSPTQDGIDTLPGKSKTGKSCLFSAFHEHLMRARPALVLRTHRRLPGRSHSAPPAAATPGSPSRVPSSANSPWPDSAGPARGSASSSTLRKRRVGDSPRRLLSGQCDGRRPAPARTFGWPPATA